MIMSRFKPYTAGTEYIRVRDICTHSRNREYSVPICVCLYPSSYIMMSVYDERCVKIGGQLLDGPKYGLEIHINTIRGHPLV